MADKAPKVATSPAKSGLKPASKKSLAKKPKSAPGQLKKKPKNRRKAPAEIESEMKVLKVPRRKLPAVPQVILDRRKEKKKRVIKKSYAKKEALLFKKLKARKYFLRAEKYVKKYRLMRDERRRVVRDALAKGSVVVPAEPKLAFVVRIRGINQVSPKVRKVLKLFRLLQINNGVFMRLNKATINML